MCSYDLNETFKVSEIQDQSDVPETVESYCVMTSDRGKEFLIRIHGTSLEDAEEFASDYVRKNEGAAALVIKMVSLFTAKKEIVVDKVQY